ncbi:hypothetical protein LEMLEM_LOCUS3818 [Lemmus lemmus]
MEKSALPTGHQSPLRYVDFLRVPGPNSKSSLPKDNPSRESTEVLDEGGCVIQRCTVCRLLVSLHLYVLKKIG